MLDDHFVEGATHIQHHRVQLSGHFRSEWNLLRRIVQVFDAECLCEPFRRIYGQNHDGAAVLRSP